MKNLLLKGVLLCATFALILLVSCGSDDSPAELSRISITSSNGDRLDLNTTTSLSVNGFDASNNPLNVTATIQWSASNNNVSVDQNGMVTALAVGTSTVTATAETIVANFEITVWDSSAPRTEIYVSDVGFPIAQGTFRIMKYDENGENGEVFATERVNAPQDIVFLEEQNVVLISNFNSNTITKHNINTGDFIENFATGLNQPTRMRIGADGLLYVLQWSGSGKVIRYQLDGTRVDNFTDTGVFQSIGMDWDDEGNFYVSSFNNGNGGSVRKFDKDGNNLGLFISSGLTGPTDIWFDSNGNLWANDWQAGSIKRFGPTGNSLGVITGGLSQNEGVAFLPNGNMLIGNGGQGNGSIKMYTPTGTFIRDLVRAGTSELRTPNAVTVRNVN